jgi:hypothetical protein
MRKRKYVLLGLLLVVAAWVCIELIVNRHWFRSSPLADVRIEVSGTPGAKVSGTFEIDGVTSERAGVLPTSFSFPQTRSVKFTITREAGQGELWASVFVNEEPKGRLGGGAEWVRGKIERGSMDSTCGQGEPQGLW